VLKSLSNHYETGKKIPDDLIYRLIKARYVNNAMSKLSLLYIAIFDIAIYTPKSHKEVKLIKIPELFNRLRREILGHNGLEMLSMSR
jgi:metallopeptidase MepB